MRADSFLDTNILVYAVSGDPDEAAKTARALELIGAADFGISAQVLQEFYVTVVRKIARPLAPAEALEWVEQFARFPCYPVGADTVQLGTEISEMYRISYWDGAILAAAQALGARTLFTEDLNDGQDYGGIRAVNPFRDREQPVVKPA
ncbi:MAG: PIN domain-containing protein [Acidobacteria bacterium]|nr:PIN domain-containing protein [Acidobacteriota bacterium]